MAVRRTYLALPAITLACVWLAAAIARPSGGRCGVSDGQASIPAGIALLGEDGPDRPGSPKHVDPFRIDRHEVTNAQFAAFVGATGYVTEAERQGGGAVFVAPTLPVNLDDARQWWRYVRGATWRHPTGPASTIEPDKPVVQVTRTDALAYARWAGGTLPTEAQWERAARGDQAAVRQPLSWAFGAQARPRANIWTGVFPVRDTGEDGFKGLAPVGCFEPNGFGLYDMIGNAWELTSSDAGAGKGIIKGGSFLCSEHYCANFRPAGFQAQELDLPTSHVGFRIVTTDTAPKGPARPGYTPS